LFHQWHDYWQATCENLRIPAGLCHYFDQPAEEGTQVRKTVRRQVVTLELSAFEAREVVRTASDHQVRRAPGLAALVPKGGKYGFDLIAHVGTETFLHGRALQAVAAELSPLAIPFSSLHDISLNPCLCQASERFGKPNEVLHDLGDAIASACDRAWNGTVRHRVCHYHLLADIGEDLYARPQTALRELVRQLKLQSRMKEQRRGQTAWLRDHVEDTTALVLWRTRSM